MKRTILALFAAAAFAGSMSAEVVDPTFYTEDFIKMGQENDFVTDGWTTYGVDLQPADLVAGFYEGSEGVSYCLLNYGDLCIPMANTNFVYTAADQQADQWLVSPEIEIPADADNAVLSFDVCVYTGKGALGSGTNPFEVYISTEGTEKADFGEAIFSGTVRGSISNEMVTKQFCIPANGYAGKKVHLAFVAKGRDIGMTGFTNLVLGNYYVSFQNNTVAVGNVGEKYDIKINVKMKTPVACPGLYVTPIINGVRGEEEYRKKEFGGKSTSPTLQYIVLENAIDVVDKNAVYYEVEFRPDYENAPVSKISGSVGVPQVDYVSNVVMEEGTATGCGFCPRGIAAINYFKDMYPGSETQGKVISIAVHGNMNYADPMNTGVADYLARLYYANGTTGLPQAMFNRATKGADPTNKAFVEEMIAERSNNHLKITEVICPELEEGDYMQGKEITVKFDARNSYDGEGLDYSAAIVLIENKVQGSTSGYEQTNYFYNQTDAAIIQNYGNWILPYLKDFLPGGSLSMEHIPAGKMTYDHVARGIWPDFFGEALPDSWVADVPQNITMKFTVPQNVLDWENVEVVVLMLRNEVVNTAKRTVIVGSDIMPYSSFVTGSGVKGVEKDNVHVERHGDMLDVVAETGDAVYVYSLDGVLLGSYVMSGASMSIDGSAWDGPVVVKVNGLNSNAVRKMIF